MKVTPEWFTEKFLNEPKKSVIQFGKVAPNYSTGRPSVIYDVDLLSGTLSKPLPYMDSYTPAAGDRVMIIKGVIIGKIL